MQKKDSNQRRHLPGWCGPECLILASSLGPRINVRLLSIGFLQQLIFQCFFLERCLDFNPCVSTTQALLQKRWSRRGGDIRTFRPGFSSTETEMQMIFNDESKHSYQISGFIQIWLVWLSLPAVLHELLTWFGYKQQLQRLTRNTEQEDVTTL